VNSSRFGANHLSAPSAGLSLFHLQFCLLASCCCFAAVAAVASSASARHLFEEVPFVACRLMAHRPVCRPRFRFGCPRCLCRHELRMRRRCPLFELFPSRLPKKQHEKSRNYWPKFTLRLARPSSSPFLLLLDSRGAAKISFCCGCFSHSNGTASWFLSLFKSRNRSSSK